MDSNSLSRMVDSRLRSHHSAASSGEGENSSRLSRFWIPRSLERSVLAGFVCTYITCAAVLASLAAVTDRHQGIATANYKLRYLWTYLPTAVFTIIAALWTHVEYRVKQLQPWITLRKGPAPAKDTLLLDYVSPWKFITLIRALKARHYLVMVVILNSLVLRLSIILSTGLFLSQSETITNYNTIIELQDRFAFEGIAVSDEDSAIAFNGVAVDYQAVATVVEEAIYGLPLPNGTTREFAFQSFTVLEPYGLSTVITEVNGYQVMLDCETPQVLEWIGVSVYDPHSASNTTYVNFTAISSPVLCPISTLRENPISFVSLPGFAGITTNQCRETSSGIAVNRLFVFFAMFQPREYVPKNVTALICVPRAEFSHLAVTLKPTSAYDLVNVSLLQPLGRNISGLEPWDVGQAIMGSVGDTWSLSNDFEDCGYGIFCLMNETLSPSKFEEFGNPQYLSRAINQTFKAVGAQIAKLYFMKPSGKTQKGAMSTGVQSRLRVHGLSLWLLEAALAFLFCTTVIIILQQAGWRCIYRNPGSLAGMAILLSSSSGLLATFRGTGAASLESIKQTTKFSRYHTSIGVESTEKGDFEIKAITPLYRVDECFDDLTISSHSRAYRPAGFSILLAVSIPTLIVAVIATLEALLQISIRKDGIRTVPPPLITNYIHFLWHYIPAIIMVLISTLVGILQSATKVVDPFISLRKDQLSNACLWFEYLAPPSFSDFRRQGLTRVRVSVMGIALILTTFLTVVVSNLYSTLSPPASLSVTAVRTDAFIAPQTPEMQGTDSSLMLQIEEMVALHNLPYPDWTYSEFVFPKIDLALTGDPTGALIMRLPAFRAELNCSVIKRDNISELSAATITNYSAFSLDQFPPMYNAVQSDLKWTEAVTFRARDPLSCQRELHSPSKQGWDSSTTPGFWEWYLAAPVDGYFGALADLTNWDVIKSTTEPSGCPTFLAWLGKISSGTINEFTALTCHPYLNTVDVEVTFVMPGYVVDTSRPPVADESTATLLQDLWIGYKSPPFNETPSFFDYVGDYTAHIPQQIDGVNVFLDTFMATLATGSQSIRRPLAELSGPSNTAQLVAATNRLFQTMCAQVFNSQYRTPLTPPDLTGAIQTFEGNFTTDGALRLVQDPVSTRILEIFLVLILVCVVVTYATTDTRDVLPKDPGSIAAIASFFADATFLTDGTIPDDAMEWSNDELRRQGIFDGLVFRMGWWPANERTGLPQRYCIDTRETKAEERTSADQRILNTVNVVEERSGSGLLYFEAPGDDNWVAETCHAMGFHEDTGTVEHI